LGDQDAGAVQADGTYPEGTVYRKVDDRLREISEIVRKFAKEIENDKKKPEEEDGEEEADEVDRLPPLAPEDETTVLDLLVGEREAALAEMTRLGVSLGAQRDTFAGLAGMGDLVVTCMSRHSRNRGVGERLGHGVAGYLAELAEGLAGSSLVAGPRPHRDFEDVPGLRRLLKGEAGLLGIDAPHGADARAFLVGVSDNPDDVVLLKQSAAERPVAHLALKRQSVGIHIRNKHNFSCRVSCALSRLHAKQDIPDAEIRSVGYDQRSCTALISGDYILSRTELVLKPLEFGISRFLFLKRITLLGDRIFSGIGQNGQARTLRARPPQLRPGARRPRVGAPGLRRLCL